MRHVSDGRLSEPSVRCDCTHSHWGIAVSITHADTSPSEVAVGSCATDARESGQIRKEAAFIVRRSVPQIAWPPLQSVKSTFSLSIIGSPQTIL